MKFIKEHKYGILMLCLTALGIISLIFGRNKFFQAGVSCACWSAVMIILARQNKIRAIEQLKAFDKEAEEIIKDIEINQTKSEYYGVVDINIINKRRVKLSKKMNADYIMLMGFGIILAVCAILSLI